MIPATIDHIHVLGRAAATKAVSRNGAEFFVRKWVACGWLLAAAIEMVASLPSFILFKLRLRVADQTLLKPIDGLNRTPILLDI
jgi:hypothetical protein